METAPLPGVVGQSGGCLGADDAAQVSKKLSLKFCIGEKDPNLRQWTGPHCSLTLSYLLLLQIGPARFRAPELLFRPDLIGEECEGLHEVLVFAIQKSDMDLRRTLFSNIVLSGGSTLFKGSCFSFSGLCYTWSLFLFLLMWNREDNSDHPACPVGWGL